MVCALLKSRGGCPWKAVPGWQCPVPAVGASSCRAGATTVTPSTDSRGSSGLASGVHPPFPVKSQFLLLLASWLPSAAASGFGGMQS